MYGVFGVCWDDVFWFFFVFKFSESVLNQIGLYKVDDDVVQYFQS